MLLSPALGMAILGFAVDDPPRMIDGVARFAGTGRPAAGLTLRIIEPADPRYAVRVDVDGRFRSPSPPGWSAPQPDGVAPPCSAVAEPEGRWRVEPVASPSAHVSREAVEGGLSRDAKATWRGGVLVVECPEPGEVDVLVRGGDGKPMASRPVLVVPDAATYRSFRAAGVRFAGRTDESGRFRMRWFEGPRQLRVTVPGEGSPALLMNAVRKGGVGPVGLALVTLVQGIPLAVAELARRPVGCRLLRSEFDGVVLTLHLATSHPIAHCPACGAPSARVHSRYGRRLAAEAALGSRVRLAVTARRFFCDAGDCKRKIFAEPLGGLAARYARSTRRLAGVHRAVGRELGGEAGARLAGVIAAPVSPDTILRRVKDAPAAPAGTPRVVGIDDWAWRKGQRYGTIVVDMESGDVVDLLPDRDADTVKKWLRAHPGVEVVSRDRSSSYFSAATEAVPEAQQVADRWHLLKNAREAVERMLDRHQAGIAAAFRGEETAPDGVAQAGAASVRDAGHPRRRERFERVRQLHRDGHSIREIARLLGMARNSIRRYLRRERCPDWAPGRRRRSMLDAHRAWIVARLAEGATRTATLHRELTARGVKVSYPCLNRYVIKCLGESGRIRPRVNAARPKPTPPPTSKQLSFDWVRREDDRPAEAASRLRAIRDIDADLSASLTLFGEFVDLIRKRGTGTLRDWLSRAEAGPGPEIRNFASSIRRDESAVESAITTHWSNGRVEGHVNRLKAIKRQMYGRAGFQLPKARVLNAA